ncbi:capsid maturation protease [Gordonia phage Evaa]|nr:capsid maturation protease [Gordonia phage Evaa]
MWPDRNDALSRTIEAEAAVEDFYAEGLRRWSPIVEASVLPSLTASALPPDPEAVDSVTDSWAQITEDLILVGMAGLWSVSVIQAMEGIDVELPEPDEDYRADTTVARTLARNSRMSSTKVVEAMARVEASSPLRRARDAYVEEQRALTSRTPAAVKLKLEMTMRKAPADLSRDALRAEIADVLSPGGETMRGLARNAGYQAAGAQNAAIEEAARASGETLEKTWICTIDSRTRPTHWAADGQRVPIDGTFTIGNEELRRPGDSRGSSKETDNCRCRMGILAPDESLPDEVDRHTERGPGDSTVKHRQGSQADEIERREERGEVRAREDPDGIGRAGINASGGWVSPSEAIYEIEETSMTAGVVESVEVFDDEGSGETYRTFTDAVIAVIGEPTSDGRMFASDIELSFRTFPLPLMWTKQSSAGHMDAYTVGVLESASVDGTNVIASGYILNTEEANEAAAQIGHGITGPSVDLAATEWMLTDEDGKEISEEDWWDLPMDAQVYQTVTKAELIGTTLVATPAFGATAITLNAERESRDVALVASAAEDFRPRVYDRRLFADPQLTGPTLPTMGDDGRIYGHLACFGECHRSIQAQCILAPRSYTNYSHFHTSPAVRLDDGSRIPVGRLTVDVGHAPDSYSGAQAAAHYDNAGSCFALVRVGEDAHGVWFSGVAAPWATAEQIEKGLSAPLSGDWRDFGTGLELVAALAVNTPGYAARGRDDDQGRPIALVASLGPAPDTERGGMNFTAEQVRDIVRATVVEMEDRAAYTDRLEQAMNRAKALTASANSDRLAGLMDRARKVNA